MSNFFKKNQEKALVVLGAVFLAILSLYFLWGLRTLTASLAEALNPRARDNAPLRFDIEGAKDAGI